MKKLFTVIIGAVVAIVCFAEYTQAQESEGQIKIKISKDVNGERSTFEGTYESKEQMEKDQAYKDFAGDDDNSFFFQFGDEHGGQIDLDQFKSGGNFFHLFSGEDDDSNQLHVIRPGQSDLHDKMKSYLEELDARMEDIREGVFDEDFRGELDDLLDEINNNSFSFGITKTIKVTAVSEDDFGKKGMVKSSELLELDDLSFYPNPSKGKLNLKFRTPSEGELRVNVYDLEGRQVYGNHYGSFGGYYQDHIDLTNQQEGIYLLEIKLDGKRLTKKILLN